MIEAKYDGWRKRNPLRLWRIENEASRATVCAAIRVSLNTVVKWEQGMNIPNLDNIEKLAKLMGRPVEELAKEWLIWLNEGKHANEEHLKGEERNGYHRKSQSTWQH